MNIKQLLNDSASEMQGNVVACYADLAATMVLATSGGHSQRQELLDDLSADAARLLGTDGSGPGFAFVADTVWTRAMFRCQETPTEAIIMAAATGDGLSARLIDAARELRNAIDTAASAT